VVGCNTKDDPKDYDDEPDDSTLFGQMAHSVLLLHPKRVDHMPHDRSIESPPFSVWALGVRYV
jgi:hypothetical protein